MKKGNCLDCNKVITLNPEFEGQTYHHADTNIVICDNCYCNSDNEWTYCQCCNDVTQAIDGDFNRDNGNFTCNWCN